MSTKTTERAFESYVEEILLTASGWTQGSNAHWDKDRAFFPAYLIAFIKETQADLWAEMVTLHGSGLEPMILSTLVKELDAKARSMCCVTGSSSTEKPFALRISNRRMEPTRRSLSYMPRTD